MKNLTFYLITLILILSITSCLKKTNKELLIGRWEVKEGKIDDDCTLFHFGADRIFKYYDGNRELEQEDHFEYRVINEQDLPNYPDFKKENDNGRIISIIIFENDGQLYTGTNIIGPFEIISISDKELCLRELKHDYFKTEKVIFNRISSN